MTAPADEPCPACGVVGGCCGCSVCGENGCFDPAAAALPDRDETPLATAWRDGYEDAICYVFPSADADLETRAEFMERADDRNPYRADAPEDTP